jgi:predicted nucleic acid-binding protein
MRTRTNIEIDDQLIRQAMQSSGARTKRAAVEEGLRLQGVKNLETEWVQTELDRQRLGLTDLILCEVLQGVRDDVAARKVERQLLKLHVFETGGVDLAKDAVRNYRTLRGHGATVRRTIDCLIATFCLREQHSLLHRDRGFDPFEQFLGLSVIHP